ncbi:MAG: BatD family protein, partial [Phycisphaerae bacterium]
TEVASVPDGDRIAFARIDVEPDSLYVTETYTATLRFGIRKVEINGQRYPLDMLRDVLDLRASQLSVFGGGNARRSERWLPDSTGARHQYELFTVTRQIRAEQVGEVQVGPVFLRVHYPLAIRRGFFGGYEITRRQRESARAESVSVTVKAPPAEGRPPDYTGAIGRFTLDVSARPTRVQQGQPITLSVSIRGTPLEGVAGPSLTGNPELASRFDYAGDELVGDIERGAKVFRRAVFPKQSGEQTIPPITWSYFDPGSERYVTLSSPPIPIVVDPPAESASVAATVESEPHGAGRETTLTVLSGGLSPNVTDPRRALATQSVVVSNAWIAGLFLWPAAWLTMTLVMRHRGRLKDDVDFARRRGARRTALRRIQQTLRSNGTVDSRLHQLGRALTGYLADRTCRGAATVTPDEVRSLLTRNGLNESSVDRIVGFLEMCDAARYTPGGVAPDAPAAVARRIKRWIRDIERSGL